MKTIQTAALYDYTVFIINFPCVGACIASWHYIEMFKLNE